MNLKTFLLSGSLVILAGCSAATTATPTTTSPTATANPATTTTTDTTSESTTTSSSDTYTLAEVAQHNSASDCWLVIDNGVYDVTSFVSDHPGGDEILNGCGKDATQIFKSQAKHSGPEAQEILPSLKIGDLSQS